MTVIVRDSYIIADIDGNMIKFGGKRNINGFAARIMTAEDLKFPDRKFSSGELDDIIRAVKAHSEKSYIEITFE